MTKGEKNVKIRKECLIMEKKNERNIFETFGACVYDG